MHFPSWLRWYKKPSYRDVNEYASAIREGTRDISPTRSSGDVPSRLSLDRILKNETCELSRFRDTHPTIEANLAQQAVQCPCTTSTCISSSSSCLQRTSSSTCGTLQRPRLGCVPPRYIDTEHRFKNYEAKCNIAKSSHQVDASDKDSQFSRSSSQQELDKHAPTESDDSQGGPENGMFIQVTRPLIS